MIKKLRKNKFSSEKGSVTLFILIAVLFFLIVSLNVYSGNKNKMVTQAEEIKAIEENYNKNLENIDEIYNDLLKDFVKTTFIKQSSINTSNKVYYNLSDWTNENIVVNVKVYSEYNPNAQLEVKVISKKTGTGVIYNKNQIDNNQVIVTENSTVIVKFGHKEQKFELTKFDKIAPTKPIITNSSQGNATNQNVSITVTSEDTLSGIDHYEWFENNAWTTRALKTENSVGKITFMAERKNLTIRFRAVDKVGNISQEATTVINLDKTAPVLSPITNSSNENWTNQPIKLSWTITENGSGIQKVQYSYDGQQWNNELEKSEWYGITIENQRNDTLYIRVIDTAGNISNVSSTKMKIDKTLPTVELGTNGGTYTVAQK